MSTAVAEPTTVVGHFVWRDMMTSDPDRTKAFYQALFGWEVQSTGDEFGGYEMLSNAGTQFGGIVTLGEDHKNVPSHWASYVLVDSVDDVTAKAKATGGTVFVEPMDIPTIGRFSVIADPQGAIIQPFTVLSNEQPRQPETPPPGSVVWNELITADPDEAKAFYGPIFGWTFEDSEMGGQQYTVIKRGDVMEAGFMKKPDEVPASMWVIYFHVADLDQALADVTKLGGQPAGPIIPVPGIGRVSWAMDPVGAIFALHENPK